MCVCMSNVLLTYNMYSMYTIALLNGTSLGMNIFITEIVVLVVFVY